MKRFLVLILTVFVIISSCSNANKRETYTFGAKVCSDSIGNVTEITADTTKIVVNESNGLILFSDSVSDTIYIVMRYEANGRNEVFDEVVYLGERSDTADCLITVRVRSIVCDNNGKIGDVIAVINPSGDYVLYLENVDVANTLFLDNVGINTGSIHGVIKSDIKSFEQDTIEK